MVTRTLDKSWTKKDFKVDWFSGTGAGEQHRNKHQNCVRITHIESGITVTGQNHRERSRNFREAFTILAKKVVEWHYGEDDKERFNGTDIIRTYNEPDNRVIDHRTKLKFAYKNFNLEDIIGEVLAENH